MTNREINEYRIVIIESLKTGERKTGTELFNNVLKYKNIQTPVITPHIYEVYDKAEFYSLMETITDEITKKSCSLYYTLKVTVQKMEYIWHQMKSFYGTNSLN